jgi:ABC-2 type transport system ATP-binding protein
MHRGRMIRCDSPAALKSQLEEMCYEVRSPQPRAARQVLQAAEGVVSVEPFGAAMHLFLSPRASVEALQNKLNSQNLGPAVFRPIAPSLEDVFIALIRKEGR